MDAAAFLKRLFSRTARGSAETALALCEALLSERGEASGATLAREAIGAIQDLKHEERARFFDALAERYAPDPDAVLQAAQRYHASPEPRALADLQAASEPLRQELLRRLNLAAGGTAALVGLRRQLLEGIDAHPAWKAIDADFLHLFRSWFNRGFLELRRIDWHTSAHILEKLIAYEAVHAIQGWDDLRRRLQADRRCFAYFHPSLPGEPLIFIEVALTRALADRIAPLIDPAARIDDPQRANHAIFYSITNCQEGLRGVSFGNFLIKQVVRNLQAEHPRLKTFATLSPVPGFAAWLAKQRERLDSAFEALDRPGWQETGEAAAFEKTLPALCAHYLLQVKRGEMPRDAVARFHLGNGAMLERVHFLADRSPNGIARGLGMMVNYVYRLEDIERNHEAFAREHRVIASSAVEKLARDCPLTIREQQASR